MIELASGTALIMKLTNSIVYAALENSRDTGSAAILGVSNWDEVRVILDSSVAIPFLCTSLFGPSHGRFSKGSKEVIRLFKLKGADLRIPWNYLNECASHLVAAQEYIEVDEFGHDFAFSQNGYVSHYYQLKMLGEDVPETLTDFIKVMSSVACSSYADKKQHIRKVMQDLQPKFLDYGFRSRKYLN